MSLRVTILIAADTCAKRLKEKKEKPIVTTQMVQAEMGQKDNRISSKLYQYDKEGFLKKIKISGGGGNGYTITAKGHKEINSFGLQKWNAPQVAEWAASNSKGVAVAPPQVSMSLQAMSAVEGISKLIEENDRLKMTLVSIQSQIQIALRDDSHESDQK